MHTHTHTHTCIHAHACHQGFLTYLSVDVPRLYILGCQMHQYTRGDVAAQTTFV